MKILFFSQFLVRFFGGVLGNTYFLTPPRVIWNHQVSMSPSYLFKILSPVHDHSHWDLTFPTTFEGVVGGGSRVTLKSSAEFGLEVEISLGKI